MTNQSQEQPNSPEHPFPVRAVAQRLHGYIDRLGAIWVKGQVIQISRRQGMQRIFLQLRDPIGDISVTATANRDLVDSLAAPLTEGASVVVLAKPSYYLNRGTLSLEIRDIQLTGIGELLAQLERRRQLLAAEGLFATELKRPLPFLPQGVGLITAHASAAERDVVEVSRGRWPGVHIVPAYAAMQGPHAVTQVIEQLKRLDADDSIDVIVIARGGGSVEDLLPFSDESLVRAVAAVRTPVVSAIGHEPDTPLLDLVADLRAATPTDAAKRIVPDVVEQRALIGQLLDRARRTLEHHLTREQQLVATLRGRPVLADPGGTLDREIRDVADQQDRAHRAALRLVDHAGSDLAHRLARVRALSPLSTLERGYAVVQAADGTPVTDAASVGAGDPLDIRVAGGRIDATVTATHPADEGSST